MTDEVRQPMRFPLLLAERPQDVDGPAADDRGLHSEPCGERNLHGQRWRIFLARGAALPRDA